MRKTLLGAGLLLAACAPAYAGSGSGQINARLTILPACGIASHAGQYQMKCNVDSVAQPKITESYLPSEPIAEGKTNVHTENRLITVEW
ncbi:hypothetical protein [Pectobacterium sp. B1J-3]|uniref:hypothetical protein n=1 Tax=Pectobacterium sp. B1J-3 TaxID=3385371 RepID=UPI0039067AF6